MTSSLFLLWWKYQLQGAHCAPFPMSDYPNLFAKDAQDAE
jgi:hypothetical protein